MLLIVMDTSQNSLMSPMGYHKAPSWGLLYSLFMLMTYCVASIEMYTDDTALHVSDSCAIKDRQHRSRGDPRFSFITH